MTPPIAVRKEKPSSPIATTRMITATSGEVSGSSLSSLWMPSYNANTEPRLNSRSATTKE